MNPGPGPSWVALPQSGHWPTVLAFLVERFPHVEATEWRERMVQGGVCSADAVTPLTPFTPFTPGLRIRYFRHVPNEPRIPFEAQILFEDGCMVVADKPHFLPVTPSGRYVQETLLTRLQHQLDLPTLTPVHRLDRDTAGLVLFCKQVAHRDAYAAMFRQRAAAKIYEAVAPWRADVGLPVTRSTQLEEAPHFMQMREVPGEANAHTRIRVIEHKGGWARYQLEPLTGKRHQLRVHMAVMGLPIRHDGIYPDLTPEPPAGETPDYSKPLQLLARELRFTDPVTGQGRVFVSRRSLAALPADD